MSASNTADFPVNTIGQAETVRVNCYVRSAVPGPIAETITALIERLEHLCTHGPLTGYQVSQWPSERRAGKPAEGRELTRDELVAEFEQWAEQHGYTLEPAFRREEIPSSPLGLETAETRERVRVPLVALALYEDDTEIDTASETLRGVVPYTERPNTGEGWTYTVDEWLSALEAKGCDDPTDSSQHNQAAVLEGQQ